MAAPSRTNTHLAGPPMLRLVSLRLRLAKQQYEPGSKPPVVNRPVNLGLAGTSALSPTVVEPHNFTLSLAGISSLTTQIDRAVSVRKDPERQMLRWHGPPLLRPTSVYLSLAQQRLAAAGPVPVVYRPVNVSLVGRSSLAATLTEYRQFTVTFAGTSAFPFSPFTTPILDNFNRANENPLSGGGNWANLNPSSGDNFELLSNVAGATGAGSQAGVYWTPTTLADCEAYVTVPTLNTGGNAMVLARLGNVGGTSWTGYFAEIQANGNVVLGRANNGLTGPTILGSSTVGTQAGDKIGIRCLGATIELWRKSGIWTKLLSATDSTYASGRLGLYSIGVGGVSVVTFDDFGGGSPVTTTVTEFQRFTLTLSGTSSLAGTFRELHRITLSLSGTSTLTEALKALHRFTVSIAGTSSLSVTTRELHRISLSLAGTSSLAVTLRELHRLTLTLAGTSSLSATLRELHRITVTMAGTSSIAAIFKELHRITVTLSGVGHLAEALTEYHHFTLTLAGAGSLVPSMSIKGPLSVFLVGRSSLATSLTKYHRFSASFSGMASLASALTAYRRFTASLSGRSAFSPAMTNYTALHVTLSGRSSFVWRPGGIRNFTFGLTGASQLFLVTPAIYTTGPISSPSSSLSPTHRWRRRSPEAVTVLKSPNTSTHSGSVSTNTQSDTPTRRWIVRV